MEFEISLENLIFYAYHGVFEEERKLGNKFRVSVSVYIPYRESMKEDELEKTLSYVDLYSIIKEEMEIPRKLMEKLALEIMERIKGEFHEVSRGFIKIEKMNTPIPGMIGNANVVLHF